MNFCADAICMSQQENNKIYWLLFSMRRGFFSQIRFLHVKKDNIQTYKSNVDYVMMKWVWLLVCLFVHIKKKYERMYGCWYKQNGSSKVNNIYSLWDLRLQYYYARGGKPQEYWQSQGGYFLFLFHYHHHTNLFSFYFALQRKKKRKKICICSRHVYGFHQLLSNILHTNLKDCSILKCWIA